MLSFFVGGMFMKHKIIDTQENIIRTIDNYIVGFKAYRNRNILKDHFVYGMTFEEIAEKYDMSVSQIKKITYDNESIIIEDLRARD